MKKFLLYTSAVLLSFGLAIGANAAELSSDVLTKGNTTSVTNPNKPDTKAPTVSSPKLGTKKLDLSKSRTITLSLKVKDDISGVSEVYAMFKDTKTDAEVALSMDREASTKTKTVLKGTVEEAGTYKFSYLSAHDVVDNRLYHDASESKTPSAFKKLSFTVKAPKNKLTATVDSFTVEGDTTVNPNDAICFSVGMTVSNEQVDSVSVTFENTKSKEKESRSILWYDEEVGKYIGYFGADYGTWQAKEVTVTGVSGAKYTVSRSEFPASLKNVNFVVNGKQDKDLPSVTKASVKKRKIVMKKNEPVSVDLALTVKDKSTGVIYADVSFLNLKTGAMFSGTWYYDQNPVKAGKITVPVNLPANIASGTYKIFTINVGDGTNSVNYIGGLSSADGYESTPTCKYVKLPSSLSKLSFTVKNTYKK